MLVLGHRGASASYPENTVAAFAAALAVGADGVELDVRRGPGSALVVSHDPAYADGSRILDLPVDDRPPDVALLDEALDALDSARLVNVEIKNWPDDPDWDPSEQLAEAVVARLLARGEGDDDRYLISAFHLPTIDRVHELAPRVATGWLVIDPGDPVACVERVRRHGHRAIHPHHLFVNAELVREAHAAGLAVNTWTADDPDRIRWLAEVGVDAVVTDDPATALAALGR